MGLKSGSRDADLDDSEKEEEKAEENGQQNSDETEETLKRTETTGTDRPSSSSSSQMTQSETKTASTRPTMETIPYKLRRDRVNEGREQVPFFLREEIIEAEDDLHDSLEEMLGEDVYKSDYREAAMVVAQQNPELVAEILREWGYDLDAV